MKFINLYKLLLILAVLVLLVNSKKVNYKQNNPSDNEDGEEEDDGAADNADGPDGGADGGVPQNEGQAPQGLVQAPPVDYTTKFNELFTDPKRENTPCDCDRMKTRAEFLLDNVQVVKDEENNPIWALPKRKNNIYAKKMIGWDASAYLFDHLDPIMVKTITDEFQRIYTSAQQIKEDPNYKDPFTIEAMANPGGDPTITNQDQSLDKLKKLIPNFSLEKWKTFISTAKMNVILKEWKWYKDLMSADYARIVVEYFDFDGDGRLNSSEFILAMIINNIKKRDDLSSCVNCMETIITRIIDPIFNYIDCDGDNSITAENIWISLKGLNRKESDNLFNMYKCVIKGVQVRSISINDFVLKTQNKTPGRLSKDDFRTGILLGYWGRQIKEDIIFNDDPKLKRTLDDNNLKALRWLDGGVKDISCDNMLRNRYQ